MAEAARERGVTPILAGRNAQRVTALATRLGFEHRVFDLADLIAVERQLADITAVLHCAGPFSAMWYHHVFCWRRATLGPACTSAAAASL